MKGNFKFPTVLMLLAVALSAGADQTFQTLEADGRIYTNVTVTTVTATDIYFTYEKGMGNAKLKDLSPELQARFHYSGATTPTPATPQTAPPVARVTVGSLIADVAPKVGGYPNMIGGVIAGFLLFFLMLRKIVKAFQDG